DHLFVPERRPESLTFPDIGDGQLDCLLTLADRCGHDRQPLILEVLHDVIEATVLLADQVVLRYPDVFEDEFGGVRATPPHLLQRPAGSETFGALRHGKDRDSSRAFRLGVGPGSYEHDVSE